LEALLPYRWLSFLWRGYLFYHCAIAIVFLLNSTKKRQQNAGVFDWFAYGTLDT